VEHRSIIMHHTRTMHVDMPQARLPAAPPRRFTLAAEITAALIVKVLFIWALWFLFFSHPLDEHLDDEGVAAALIGGLPDLESTPPQRR
jgi:hypothetical protein